MESSHLFTVELKHKLEIRNLAYSSAKQRVRDLRSHFRAEIEDLSLWPLENGLDFFQELSDSTINLGLGDTGLIRLKGDILGMSFIECIVVREVLFGQRVSWQGGNI
jgi:hypothetical protein